MVADYGDRAVGSVLYFFFNTEDPTGAPITLAGSPSLACYKDNSDTQSTAGLTLGVDADGVTGLHRVTVNTAADGTFYASGCDFSVVLAGTPTVNGVSVLGKKIGSFSLVKHATDAAAIRSAVGLASANLDTQLSTIAGYLDTEIAAILAAVDTEVAAIKAKTDLIPGTLDGKTFAEGWTLVMAVLLGKASGLDTTTAIYRAVNDSKDRVTATVDDDGNRTAVTLDAA